MNHYTNRVFLRSFWGCVLESGVCNTAFRSTAVDFCSFRSDGN
jgi:hypothetical protein